MCHFSEVETANTHRSSPPSLRRVHGVANSLHQLCHINVAICVNIHVWSIKVEGMFKANKSFICLKAGDLNGLAIGGGCMLLLRLFIGFSSSSTLTARNAFSITFRAYCFGWWWHITWLTPWHSPCSTCNAGLSNFVGFGGSCDDGVCTPSFSIPDSSRSWQLSSIHSHMLAKPKWCQWFDAWHICWCQSSVFDHVLQTSDHTGAWKDTGYLHTRELSHRTPVA